MSTRGKHVQGPSLARDSGRTILGAAVSTLCNFAVIVVVARGLGAGSVGMYSVAFAMRAILVLVCGAGMRVALTHFMASAIAREDWGGARGAKRLGITLPLTLATTVGAILVLGAGPLAEGLFDKPDLATLFRLVGVSLPFSVLMDVSLSGTQGFQTMRAHARIGLILEPALRLALTAAAIGAGLGLRGAMAALLVASVVAGLAAIGALSTMTRRLPPAAAVVPWSAMPTFAVVSWVASMATQGLLWADVVILGVLVSSEEVGVYQVASRVVLAAMLVITPLTTSMAPRIAGSWARHDLPRLMASYTGVVLWSWRLTLPTIVGIVVVPLAALSAFGEAFDEGVAVVYLLALGALVESAAAPSAVLLNQIGRNKLNMIINLCALSGNVALNFILVPQMGIVGAAVAWAAALVVPGIARVVVVHRTLGQEWPIGRHHAQSLAAGALAGGAAAAVVWLTPVPGLWPVQLLVAGLVILAVYVPLVAAFGLRPQERTALRRRLAILARGLSTKIPALRRSRNRWRMRSLVPGEERIEIRTLLSPYRYDILARLELFRLARQHREALEQRPAEFLEIVANSIYRVWFDAVVAPGLGLAVGSKERELAFAQNIRRSMHLLESFERRGFDTHHPISVTRVKAGTPVGGRALGEDRWAPLDGCHRLSLLLLSGQTHLEPHQYVVSPRRDYRFNTERVARAERKDRDDLLEFYAWGLVDDPTRRRVASWEDLVEEASPVNAEALSAWPEADLLGRDSPPRWFEAEQGRQASDVVR